MAPLVNHAGRCNDEALCIPTHKERGFPLLISILLVQYLKVSFKNRHRVLISMSHIRPIRTKIFLVVLVVLIFLVFVLLIPSVPTAVRLSCVSLLVVPLSFPLHTLDSPSRLLDLRIQSPRKFYITAQVQASHNLATA